MPGNSPEPPRPAEAPSSSTPAQRRSLVIGDSETDGLDVLRNEPVEVAWLRFREYGSGSFVPPHSLTFADPGALRINRYEERLRAMPWDDRYSAAEALHIALRGNVLVGANPAFDAAMLRTVFRRTGLSTDPWHHRLLDVSAFGAGVLGIHPALIPGLNGLATLLDIAVDAREAHTAMGDCRTTAAVLDRLLEILAARAELGSLDAKGLTGEGSVCACS